MMYDFRDRILDELEDAEDLAGQSGNLSRMARQFHGSR